MKKVIWNAGFFCEAKQLLCVTQKIPFLAVVINTFRLSYYKIRRFL